MDRGEPMNCTGCGLPLAHFAGPAKGQHGLVCQTPGCDLGDTDLDDCDVDPRDGERFPVEGGGLELRFEANERRSAKEYRAVHGELVNVN